jgi:gliding motility-associated-like protein
MKKLFLNIAIILFACLQANATHIFGGEFTYEHISGNNYRFNLTLYADCAGSQNLLSNLYTATPQIERYNNNVSIDNFTLTLIPGSGIEVSPVCPNDLPNTTCASTSGTVPGVRQFKYTGTKNLGSTSANWKFMFWGNLIISNNQTGRSSNISNIYNTTCGTAGSSSKMSFEATLNNLAAPNSTVTYTTIPTPFHCVNKAQSYNQGAIDPDADLLSFALVDGIDGNAQNIPITCLVSYVSPYNALNPLGAVVGTFNFSNTTGQLNYTPSISQYSLVVVKVTETRAGVVVGTTMREMSFVVFSSCANTPPGGFLNTVNTGYIDSLTNIYVCKSAASLVFTVPATDSDGNNVTVTYAGLPTGCTLAISGNGTSSPTITGTYTPAGGFVVGNYNFFVTYEDDGCPLKSKQTIAYTIHVLPIPSVTTTVVQPTCLNGAVGSVVATASGGTPSYQYTFGSTPIGTNNSFTNVTPGSYALTVTDAKGCKVSTNIALIAPPLPVISNIVKTLASCQPGCDGTINIVASTPSATTLSYSANNGTTYQSSASFAALCVGAYTIVVKDANGCSTSSLVNILAPVAPVINSLVNNNATCTPGCDGSFTNISASSSTSTSFTYKLNAGAYQSGNSFSNVCVGTYTIYVKDANGCVGSSIVNMNTPPGPTFNSVTSITSSCVPGCDGQFTNISATSGAGGVQYSLNGGSYQTNNSFIGLCANIYTLYAKDANGCVSSSVANIAIQPNPIINSVTATKSSCVPGCDASITVSATASFGLSLGYQINTNTPQVSTVFNNVCKGNYTITVADTKGCKASTIVAVVQESDPIINTSTPKNVSCYGYNNGSITIAATGSGAINYLLLPANTLNSTGAFTPLLPGAYSIIVTDAKGCTISQNYTILEPPILAFLSVTKEDKTCEFKNNGVIDIKILGGTNPFTYNLNNGAFVNNSGYFNGMNSGGYSIVVTDANGCSIVSSITILPPLDPMKISTTFKAVPCNGTSTDGWVEVAAVAGTQPYTYTWNTNPVSNTPRIENLYAGTFIIVVTDAKGCDLSDTLELRDPAFCCTDIFIPNVFTPNQDGKNDNLEIKTGTTLIDPIFLIYDRWGKKVYETTDIEKRWNGDYPNNLQGDLAIYFYLLKYKCAVNNKEYVKKGDVLLAK